LAWKHRAQSPVIKVKTSPGGADARAPYIQMIPRSSWANGRVRDGRDGTTRDYAHVRTSFDNDDFFPDKHFIVSMEIFHRPGKENWPVHMLSMNFMDDMDARCALAGGKTFPPFGSVRVRLTGLLRAPHLNGREGTLVRSLDGDSGRSLVSLDDGSQLSVKQCNYLELNRAAASTS
jgi:hypothetical protein